ncbi:MAG: glycosyltransferase family 4 protein [Lentisphaerae bacterium]|nr:glycosyltransferase family 4 protein [Lentisphaerota bacterium]
MSSQPPTYSPPRVLFLDCAPFCGGAQESLLSLLTALRSQDQPMLLLTADSCPNGLGERAQAAGINTTAITTRHWRKSLSGLWQFWVDHRVAAPLLQQAATDFQPDLVHCNGIRAALLYRMAMPEASRRLPVVIHDRDLRLPLGVRAWLARSLSPHVVAISSTVGRLWQRCLPPRQIHVVPNGFPLAHIQATTPAALPFASNDAGMTSVILPADFVTWKRHDLFLRTVALARQQKMPLRAILRGRIRDAASHRLLERLRQQAAALGLNSDVLAFITDPGPALPWIAAADIMFACARHEPFGRTIVEALALGKPIVATPTAGAPEIIADCPAITIAGDDHAALAKALAAWLSPERRQQCAAAARARAECFSMTRHVTGIQAVHAQCLE